MIIIAPTSSPFLRLPQEIRLRIYDVLNDDATVNIDCGSRFPAQSSCNSLLSIAHVSKQLHHEAMRALKFRTLHLSSLPSPDQYCFQRLLGLVKKWGQGIERLVLDVVDRQDVSKGHMVDGDGADNSSHIREILEKLRSIVSLTPDIVELTIAFTGSMPCLAAQESQVDELSQLIGMHLDLPPKYFNKIRARVSKDVVSFLQGGRWKMELTFSKEGTDNRLKVGLQTRHWPFALTVETGIRVQDSGP